MVNERLSKMMEKLWSVNENKLTRNVDYALDLQSKSRPFKVDRLAKLIKLCVEFSGDEDNFYGQSNDYEGARPLFSYLDVQNILRRPTFRSADH